MALQSQKVNRSKDPFSVQPLPKSFYHPSPTKEVNEREAIRSPQRRNNPTIKCSAVEEYHISAVPNVRKLYGLEQSDLQKQGEVIDSSELDETWPDNERPNSFSTTSVTEDTEAGSPGGNIGDVVNGLGKLKYQQRSSGGEVDSSSCDRMSAGDAGESVLQRYVERFRNSAPKSREERMKEKSDKLHFWWLQASSDRGTNSVGADNSKGNNLIPDESLPEARPQPQKLTKDALLAMDEETFHLQSKADRLLSRSELSLASSSPIVSTEGLGSSASVSSSSVADDQLLYQPVGFRAQENYNRPAARPVVRTEDKSRLSHTASRSPADDILTRWRLQRKMEEANAGVLGGQRGRLSSAKHSKFNQNTELDVRLGEFRKKILSQKALVTQQDILYERQRLTLLLDDVRQNGENPNKDTPQILVDDPAKDVILEKLQRITRSQDYRPAGVATSPRTMDPGKTFSSSAISADDRNFSINNANFVNAELSKHVESSLVDPALNINNTALSNQQVPQSIDMNAHNESDVFVDSFGSQVVFDPKKKQFLLENSGTESSKSSTGSLIDDGVREVRDVKKKVDTDECYQKQMQFTGNVQNGETVRNAKCTNDARSEKTNSLVVSQQGSGDNVQTLNRNNMASDRRQYIEKEQKQINKRVSENFYQYLEAEKPISESKLHVKKGNKTDKVMNDDTVLNSEEEQEQKDGRKEQKEVKQNLTSGKLFKNTKQSDEKEGAVEDRAEAREQKKRKSRQKQQVKKGREKDCVDASVKDVLVDITNERNDLVTEASHSETSSVKGHLGNVISSEKKDLNVYPGRLGKKSRTIVASAASPGRFSASQRASSLAHQPVQHAIGQAIADHLFDGSTLASSVDSWASAFPQSPILSHSINGSGYSTASPSPSQRDNTPLESTPRLQVSSDQQAGSDDEYTSDGEFQEDALLLILRQQRHHFLQQLICIEKKLQEMET